MPNIVDRSMWLGQSTFSREGYTCARTDISLENSTLIVRGIIQIANTQLSTGVLKIPTLLSVHVKDTELQDAVSWNAEHLRQKKGNEYQVDDLVRDLDLSKEIRHPYHASVGKIGPDAASMEVLFISHGKRGDIAPSDHSVDWSHTVSINSIINFVIGLQESYPQLACTPGYSHTSRLMIDQMIKKKYG